MAAAARLHPADARIPCPLCAGLIHPIAGRCKHCKGDLSVLRAGRPAAASALPALANGHGVAPTAAGGTGYAGGGGGGGANGQSNGHAHANGRSAGHVAAYAPMPVAQPAAPMPVLDPHRRLDGSQPILPPRPTGRMPTSHTLRPSWWKSWPLIVIILAGLAIVVAAVLMVWPPGGKSAAADDGKKSGIIPAPERMDTNPLLPNDPSTPKSGDPWTPKPKDPGATPTPPPATPDIDIPDDPAAPTDPADPTAGNFGGLSGSSAIMMSMMRHACERASSCGHLDSLLKDYCDMTKKVPTPPPPASCPAAAKCLKSIDEMSCTTGFDDINALSSVMYKFQDCVEAISC
ncbi:MAG: hypothetical protein ABI867_09765 [Kofleriaceae bacterium]